MSVVKDLFKLRKYNIHEVNEQIFQSQNNSRPKDNKGNDPSIEKTNDNNQNSSTTDTSSHIESTTVDNTSTANQDTVKT